MDHQADISSDEMLAPLGLQNDGNSILRASGPKPSRALKTGPGFIGFRLYRVSGFGPSFLGLRL